jgi:hypothetical protein
MLVHYESRTLGLLSNNTSNNVTNGQIQQWKASTGNLTEKPYEITSPYVFTSLNWFTTFCQLQHT